jgi:hypothetical protein
MTNDRQDRARFIQIAFDSLFYVASVYKDRASGRQSRISVIHVIIVFVVAGGDCNTRFREANVAKMRDGVKGCINCKKGKAGMFCQMSSLSWA